MICMENPLIRKAVQKPESAKNKFASLGLTDNPFPKHPGLSPGGDDPRSNGSIYCDELAVDKQRDFIRLLIPTPENSKPYSIAFLMDAATRSGRGIGKSAFLYNQCSKIVKDFGNEATRGTEVVFAVCVRPMPRIRKFWEICRSVGDAFAESKVVEKAIWRLRISSGQIPDNAIQEILRVNNWENTVGDDNWLDAHQINTWELNRQVKRAIVEAGLPEPMAHAFSYLSGNARNNFNWMTRFSDYHWRRDGAILIFDYLVKLFMAAGFTRGLLLIDEVEKFVYYENTEERRNFAESLRYYSFDANVANSQNSFYGILLTIHPLIQELLIPHWRATGIDRFSPLSQPNAKDSTIYFRPLTEPMVVPLVKVYLDVYRVPGSRDLQIEPFTDDALAEALIKSKGVPGEMLVLLHHVINFAADKGLSSINKKTIVEVASLKTYIEEKESSSDEIPPPTDVELTEG